jgi:3-deoxy-7-phosphoheptulonate synthase
MYKNVFGPEPKYELSVSLQNKSAPSFICIGGPCSIESYEQVIRIFDSIDNNVTHFRGGVFRAGTYPGKKWGWQWDLLKMYHEESFKRGKPNIVDVLDVRDLEKIDPYADVFQVGTRQSQHYALLKELGKQQKPIVLKRGTHQTLNEFMGSLEYILQGDNSNVILCERGSVSYLDHSRWELSISMIATLKHITKFPIIVDSSHGTGNRQIVGQMAYAGVAAGADGILIETHYSPSDSISDSEQCVSLDEFNEISTNARRIKDLL